MTDADLKKTIGAGESAGAEIKLHREDSAGHLHRRIRDRVRSSLQCAAGQQVVKLELHVEGAVRRRATVCQRSLVGKTLVCANALTALSNKMTAMRK